ncbi:hypothetical protein [Ferruginibacter sp. SUN106]|uniref:hypothetical protein n=1 Tax=Ferruginibacter sp. SUN106 TaxID=2978348 RepID=UPI003D367210
MKPRFLFIFFFFLSISTLGQTRNCNALHTGVFTASSEQYGTTVITRTKRLQIEENTLLGYKLAYTINWKSDCVYELKLKKVIKGDQALIRESKYILTIKITQIKPNSYITENSSTFSDEISTHEIKIIK